MSSNALVVTPLTPVMGAYVEGVDLGGPVSSQTFEEIHDAWLKHLVLFFRDQSIGVDELARFGGLFGELHSHPQGDMSGHPGVLEIHTDENSKVYAGHDWHSDVSCDQEPPSASILHLRVVPDCGGDTLFANMYAAYEALSAPMKSMLEGLHARHAGERTYRGYFGQQPDEMRDGTYPEFVHPVVRTHPESGRKALYVNSTFTESIVEMPEAEGKTLLDFLYTHSAQPRFQCRFQWQPNSIAVWDNRCTQHMALWDYYPQTRSGHRVTVLGDRPV